MIFVHTLGTALIDTGSTRLTPASARKFAMLLYLSAEAGRPVSKVALQELIFPDQGEKNAKHSLRELVYQFRHAGVEITSGLEGVALSVERVASDYAGMTAARRLNAEQVRAAAGGFLPGYAPDYSEAFSEWLSSHRAAATFDVCKALLRELARSKTVADWAMAERAARSCLVLDPLNEEATLALAEVLAVGGSKAQAVTLLDRYIEDAGRYSADLRLPAKFLRRRLGERTPARFQAAIASPFVGREREMLILADHLDRALAGKPQCVVLNGEPGIGKSRLATEFATTAMLQGVRVERATARPHDAQHPMGAFVDLVPQLLALPGGLGCAPESMTALTRLTRHDPAGADDVVASVRRSEAVSAGIIRAIGDLVDAIASENPLLLWLEDAQWLDEMSIAALGSLTKSRDPRRLLVIMTTRDHAAAQALARQAVGPATVSLAPLDRAAATSLVDYTLAGEALDTVESGSWILDAADGNPFYLNCLLSHLRQTGERFTVPATINLFVDQRLATLTDHAAVVLETCVLLGKYSTLERLTSALDVPQFTLLGALRELERARVVEQNGDQVQPAHWLIAESVRRNAGRLATQLSHRRIAALLSDEAARTQSAALLWDCGEHWIAAGDVERAATVMRQCSRHSLEIGHPREASELLLRAAVLAPSPLKIELGEEGVRLASGALEHELVLRGINMLRDAGFIFHHDDLEVAELYALSVLENDGADPAPRFVACLHHPDSSDSHRVRIGLALIMLADHHHDSRLAAEAFSVVSSLPEPDPIPDKLAFLKFLLVYHASFGSLDESVRIARHLLAFDLELTLEDRADLLRKAGLAFWFAGHAPEAMAALTQADAYAAAHGWRRMQFSIALMCATLLTDAGDYPAANRWRRQAEQVADDIPSFRDTQYYIIVASEIAASSCDPEEIQMWHAAALKTLDLGSNHRARRWVYALDMLNRHLSGAPIATKEVVAQLTKHNRDGENGAAGDFEMAVSLRIARATAHLPAVRKLLSDYVLYRRGRQPLSRALQEAIKTIESDESSYCAALVGTTSPDSA